MSINPLSNNWQKAIANDPEHKTCFKWWTELLFDGRYHQFENEGVPFREGVEIILPGQVRATLISLFAFHKKTRTYKFLAVINRTTTYIYVENRPEPVMTLSQKMAAANINDSADDNGGDQTAKNND